MSDLRTNTILGATLGACLLVMGLRIGGEDMFHVEAPEKPGYDIDISAMVSEAGGGGAAADEGPTDWGVLLASADPALIAQGQKSSAKCASCHSFTKGGPTLTGPNLYDIVGRKTATKEGFNFSEAMKAHGGTWTLDSLDIYLKSPQREVPGSLMTFVGIRNHDERAALIGYLRTLSDSPVPLPPPLPPKPEAPADSGAPAEGADAPAATPH